MPAPWPITVDQLAAAHSHFDSVDRVPGRPDVSDFKRHARWQQAWWRQQQGFPIGSHVSPGATSRTLNGSKVEYEAARATGCNFLSPAIRAAVGARLAQPQLHQTLDETRLWADLLSSMPLCFNLFGEVAGDADRLTAAVDTVWAGHPGVAAELRFEWSPGRGDPRYLNNRSAFDAAVLLALPNAEHGVIGIETKYHEDIRRERAPDPLSRLPRYCEVAERSQVFAPGWQPRVVGTDLQQIWLDHLLVLSMLQHPSAPWAWGRFVLVYPSANPSVRDAALRYRELLAVGDSFETRTIEELLDADVLHTPVTAQGFRERYLW